VAARASTTARATAARVRVGVGVSVGWPVRASVGVRLGVELDRERCQLVEHERRRARGDAARDLVVHVRRDRAGRDLTGEIIGQLWHANRTLLADGVTAPWIEHGRPPITNVVMMGMGEPLANFDNVVPALRLMLDDNAYGLSRRRVTLSTSGLVPLMDRLRDECPVALAVSLHAPDNALRDRLMPINRTHPLADLMAACVTYG